MHTYNSGTIVIQSDGLFKGDFKLHLIIVVNFSFNLASFR